MAQKRHISLSLGTCDSWLETMIWRPVLSILLIASMHSTTVGAVCQSTVTYISKDLDICLDSTQVTNEVNQQIVLLIESEVDCTLPTVPPTTVPPKTASPSTEPPTTKSPSPPSTETPTTPQPTIPTPPPPANGTIQNPASSCKYIPAGSPSGFYWISGSQSATLQYCDTSRSCCGSTGGWMRVVDIDMTDSSQQCPSGFNLYNYNGIRSCGRGSAGTGCISTTFSVSTVQYSKVCGRIVGYQNGTTDAFDPYINLMHGIEQNYVDGISLTHGRSPRDHIWTFAAALHEFTTFPDTLCPCISPNIAFSTSNPIPSFVGQDYFCDTGDYVTTGIYQTFFSGDPLWDGQGCGTDSTCCTLNSPPWFCKQLSSSTRDDIELRLCRSAVAEDAPFGVVEIYVQ